MRLGARESSSRADADEGDVGGTGSAARDARGGDAGRRRGDEAERRVEGRGRMKEGKNSMIQHVWLKFMDQRRRLLGVSAVEAEADLYSRPHLRSSPAMFRPSMKPSTSAMPKLSSSARA